MIKYGFEYEGESTNSLTECESCEGCGGCTPWFDKIYDDLSHKTNNIITNIKEDGSLTYEYGFEINSVVFNNFREFKEGLINLSKELKERGYKTPSPTAIHLHTSNIKSPLKFVTLSHSFDEVWGHIRNMNNSGLMFSPRTIEYNRLNPQLRNILRLDGRITFREYLSNIGFENNRGRTIRNRGSTLEFRPIPNRINPEYVGVWLKIYEGLIKKSYSMSYTNIRGLYNKLRTNNPNRVEEGVNVLQKLFKLSNYELYILTHKINRNTKNRFNELEERESMSYEFFVD